MDFLTLTVFGQYMKRCFCYLFLMVLFYPVLSLNAQMSIDSLDLKKIHHRKIKQFVERQQQMNFHCFSELSGTCCDKQDVKSFHTVQKIYKVNQNIELLWKAYKTVSPAVLWNNSMMSFGFMYSFYTDTIMYPGDRYCGIQPGEVMYLNMKMLRGIFNLALAFKIIEVDDDQMIIEMSYVEGGKAEGKQIIQLVQSENGKTLVYHTSIFKSNSKFRDSTLYPFYHNKVTRQFHRKVKNISGKLFS